MVSGFVGNYRAIPTRSFFTNSILVPLSKVFKPDPGIIGRRKSSIQLTLKAVVIIKKRIVEMCLSIHEDVPFFLETILLMTTRIVHIIAPPRENKEKKNSKNPKNPKKVFFAFFGGPHKFVENRQISRKDFKIYKRSIICYEI